MLALEAASRSAILHSASRLMSFSALTEATGQPSFRAAGRPQASGGSAYTGNAVSGPSAASRHAQRQHQLRHARGQFATSASVPYLTEDSYPTANQLYHRL